MRALRILAVVLLLAGAGERARADDTPSPEAIAAANELFTILSADMMKQLTGQMTGAFWPVVEQKAHADKIDDATIAELRAEFERIQISFVTDAMKEAPPIYARHFTVAELRDLSRVLPHANRRQGAARTAAGHGRIRHPLGAADAGLAAADHRRIYQNPSRARLRKIMRERRR